MPENIVIGFEFDTSKIQGGLDALEKLGQIDKQTADLFRQTNTALQQRTTALNEVKDSADTSAKSMNDLSKAASDVTKNLTLGAAKQTVDQLGQAVDNANQKTQSFRAQLRTLREELNRMESAGLANTKQFNDVAIAAAKVEHQIQRTNERLAVLASPTKNIEALVGAVRGLAAGFELAQGAAALFGDKSEVLQETLVKIQAAMAVVNGLAEIQKLLFTENAAKIEALTIAETLYNVVVGDSVGVMKVFRIALASTGVGLLILAIGALVENFDKIKAKVLEIFPSLAHLGDIFTTLKGIFFGMVAGFVEGIEGVGKALGDLFTGHFADAVDDVKNIDLKGAFVKEFDATKNAVEDGGDKVADAMDKAAAKIAVSAKKVRDASRPKNETIGGIAGGGAERLADIESDPEVLHEVAVQSAITKIVSEAEEERRRSSAESTADFLDKTSQLTDQVFQFGAALNARALADLEDKHKKGLIGEKAYATQVAAIKRKQAIADKAASAFGIIINTAEAILKTEGEMGFLPAAPLIPFIVALGAAQLATVLAQPIPSFATGTKNAPPGFKIVGEHGPELINDGGGYSIIPNKETQKILANWNIPDVVGSMNLFGENVNHTLPGAQINYDELGKAVAKHLSPEIQNIPITNYNIDHNKIQKSISKGKSQTTFLNNRWHIE